MTIDVMEIATDPRLRNLQELRTQRRYDCNRVTYIAHVVNFDLSGENRFYIAAEEGDISDVPAYFAWGHWHDVDKSLDGRQGVADDGSSDATYSFLNGGAWFSSRVEAIKAIYLWIQREIAEDMMTEQEKAAL